MRIALISDLHGNLHCLEHVLADLDTQGGAERIVCLGDCCFGGPEPVATLRLLRTRCQAWVPGNHDLELIDPQRYGLSGGWTREMLDRNLAELTPDDLAFIRSWPPAVRIPLPGGGDLLAFHALPADPDFPSGGAGGPTLRPREPLRHHRGGQDGGGAAPPPALAAGHGVICD